MIESAPESWLNRNWKWFVPVGCLSIIVLFAAFACAVMFLVFTAMKSTDAYETALDRAASSEEVTNAIGTPLEPGVFVTGNVRESGVSGHAELAIPISGPKGEATIYVVADKSAGRWSYTTLIVEVEATGRRIDLNQTER